MTKIFEKDGRRIVVADDAVLADFPGYTDEGIDSDAMAITARATRNELLAETDFYALQDVTMTAAMTTYRQALRDVPAQSGFPNTITWPTKP